MNRRDFLAGSAAVALAAGISSAPAQPPAPPPDTPRRKARTTKMFKAPGLYPNGLAVAPEGLWIAQQIEPPGADEAAWLVDWNGKLLKTVMTRSRTTSGMAYGNDCIWMGANSAPEGFFQTDMNSKTLRHLQIPLGLPDNGGGTHGAQWHDGKIWIVANRLRGNLRVDPATWTPEFMIPIYTGDDRPRWHDMTFDDQGFIWQVSGNASTSPADGKAGLIKYDATTGKVLELVDLEPGSCDPHGLEFHDGKLISCDSGEHPGWPLAASPTTGWIFSIDLV
ncbi:MAG: twin-arginine translocation signal domain-containing protein [Acidobacteriota bacterium]